MKDAEANGAEDYVVDGYKGELDKAKAELEELKSAWLNLVNEKPEYKLPESARPAKPEPEKYPTPNPEPTPGTSAPDEARAQQAPSTNNPAEINPRTSANSAQAATEEKPSEKPAVAQAVAEAPKAEESKPAELPNTGSAEFAVFTPAVLSILAGLGLVAPKGTKEDK